jgi:cytochrome P450
VGTAVPMNVAGLQVPAGQLIFLMSRVVATSPQHFSDPLLFKPERWLAESENGEGDRADDTRRKIFPFGGGPRYCPGRYLAMVEIKAVVAMALRNFKLQLAVQPEDIKERLTFTMAPESLPLRFVPR